MITSFINSYINIVTIILLIGAVVISLIHMAVFIRRTKLPKIKVFFPGDTTTLERRINEISPIPIQLKNIGKNTITGGDVCVYVPMCFSIQALHYLKKTKTSKEVNQTINGHPLGDMQYLYTGEEFSLTHDEPGEVQLVTKMPDTGGKHHFKVHFISDQGEGGTHDLTVIIR